MNYRGAKNNEFNFSEFKKSDEKTFEIIFESYYESMVGFCSQFIPDVDEAKNFAQQAFIKLWLNRQKIEKKNGIRAFLYTAAKTECLNFLRHEKYRLRHIESQILQKENQLNLEILESFQFNRLEYVELQELIRESIDKLPEKCRLVFVKSRLEGKKNSEIAVELDIAEKSVEANITRALKFLRKELADYLPMVLWIF